MEEKNTSRPLKKLKLLVAALALVGVLALFGALGGLDLIGQSIVHEDALQPAEAIVVLTGSFSGNRVEEAVRLYKKGLGKWLVFTGYPVYPGTFTDTFMKHYAIQLGVPEDKILTQEAPANTERNTFGEARLNLDLLKKKGIERFILVTSQFHTGRARFVYRQVIAQEQPGMSFITHGAFDSNYPVEGWWESREGQKGMFYEVTKNLYYRLTY